MMRKLLVLVPLVLLGLGSSTPDVFRKVKNGSFAPGEELEYRIHWGFVNAGEATVEVSKDFYRINDRVCYRVNVFGKTTGIAAGITRVRNTYRSFIDTAALIPHHFYVNIQEGKYRKEENVFFDQRQHTVKSEEKNEVKEFKTPNNVQDIVSGYYFLRTVNFNKLHEGDTIKVHSFFDDELYDFKVRYRGRGEVDTKFGKIKAIQITPVMPPNQLFDGDSSIRVWISDDANKIPVKIEADMFVGKIEMDLKRHKGLKTEPKWF